MNSPDLGGVDGDEDQQPVRSSPGRCSGAVPRRWCCGAAPPSPASEMAGADSALLPEHVAAALLRRRGRGAELRQGAVASEGCEVAMRRIRAWSGGAGGACAAVPRARDSGGASLMGPRRSTAPRAAAPPARRGGSASSLGCFVCWFRPAQTNWSIVFSSYKKSALASPNQYQLQPANRPVGLRRLRPVKIRERRLSG